MSEPQQTSDCISFTLSRKEFPVDAVLENGEKKKWKLREMVGMSRDKYMDFLSSRQSVDANGNVSIKKVEGIQAQLISRCLYDEKDELVNIGTILEWPATVLDQLFNKCQEMNGIGRENAEAEKKG